MDIPATANSGGDADPGPIISKGDIAGFVVVALVVVLGATLGFRKCRRWVNKRGKGEGVVDGGEDEKAKHTDEMIGEAARQGISVAAGLLGP